ncbi:hypothetical protein KP509_04G077800 [Ceratopteris richardii]|uniref:J domain-containing protein n=1 Tax=Ceratopteris richardii TaxID=49495 RepID=A0A8T2UYM7_CERRI|nr:hypothetical protein KP509_04G077800 [Ceratopteris richardii]
MKRRPDQLPSSSPSTLLRERGNVHYRQALEPGLCSLIQKARLLRALRLYEEADAAGRTVDEKASCQKNIGMLQWASCKLELNQLLEHAKHHGDGKLHITHDHLSGCKYPLFGAVHAISKALKDGAKSKSSEWLNHVHSVLEGMIEWASEQTSMLCLSRSPLLSYIIRAFEDDDIPAKMKLLAYRSYADSLFKEALCTKVPNGSTDHKASLSLLDDSRMYLTRALVYFDTDPDDERKRLQEEIKELQHSVDVHTCVSEAKKSIHLGDICLGKALTDEEDIDMERIKDSLDYYRQASLATRELDMGTEALAMSRIGKVYSGVLSLPERAYKFHYQAVKLALTVMTPNIEKSDWYKYSLEKVKTHQDAIAVNESEQHEKNRALSIRRLKEKIDALKTAGKGGAAALLKHVYEEHPHPDIKKNIAPRVKTHTEIKASLKKAILHYHPDSNVYHGEDWKVLCEEITKCLNSKYAFFKGVE